MVQLAVLSATLPETNIFAPENQWLEDEFPFGMAHLQVQTVGFRQGKLSQLEINGNHVTTDVVLS